MQRVVEFLKAEDGPTAVEYAVMLALIIVVCLGTITAVGGGMTRDICLRRVPQIFAGGTLYTTCAVLASGVMIALYRVGDPSVRLALATATGAGLTPLARWRGWGVPEAPVWQPSQAWSHAAQLRWALNHEKHKEPLPDSE